MHVINLWLYRWCSSHVATWIKRRLCEQNSPSVVSDAAETWSGEWLTKRTVANIQHEEFCHFWNIGMLYFLRFQEHNVPPLALQRLQDHSGQWSAEWRFCPMFWKDSLRHQRIAVLLCTSLPVGIEPFSFSTTCWRPLTSSAFRRMQLLSWRNVEPSGPSALQGCALEFW